MLVVNGGGTDWKVLKNSLAATAGNARAYALLIVTKSTI